MKRKKGILCLLMCGVLSLLVGCGTRPYNLTEEEQQKIADYSAHIITKYNGSQKEGIVRLDFDTLESLQNADEPDAEEPSGDADASANGSQDASEGHSDQPSDAGGASDTPQEQTVPLGTALQLEDGLTATFSGHDVTDSYVESDYFAMNALSGKSYLVYRFQLAAGNQDVSCDMLAKGLKFRAVINGDQEVSAQTSILLNDLGTYQGTIAAGTTQECVLLFEAATESLSNIESLGMKVGQGNTWSLVDLE